MAEMLISVIGQHGVNALALLVAFALTAAMNSVFVPKLPQDHGREYAVNGALSKGKARGAGVIFVPCAALTALALVPFGVECLSYMILFVASMLTGYLDDAAEKAWNEYKKGLLDFIIAALAGVTYLNFNGTGVNFLGFSFALPYWLYLALIVILVWTSINAVNCTDGVDGLSAGLDIISVGTFLLVYSSEIGEFGAAGAALIGALAAYLWYNAKPSTVLMGDAGSRAMGFLLAVLALKSGHPFAYLLAAAVFIIDGMLGILKISLKRFLHISILKNTRTPLHDHVRKNKNGSSEPQKDGSNEPQKDSGNEPQKDSGELSWSDEQVVARWMILQLAASALLALLAAAC